MTLTPEQLVNLIAAAEKFARAWEAADGTADDARDELTDVVTSIRAADYGVVRMPTETFANIQPAQELFCPDCDMAWTQHPNQACTNIPPRAAPPLYTPGGSPPGTYTADAVIADRLTDQQIEAVKSGPGYLLADMDTTPADVQDRIDQMQAGTTRKPCHVRDCDRPRNHLLPHRFGGNASETGL